MNFWCQIADSTTWVKLRAIGWRAAVGFVWLAAIIDVFVRDRAIATAICFYATPPVLLGLAMLILAGLGRRWECHLIVIRSTAIAGLMFLVVWIASDFRWESSQPADATSSRLLFWNVGRGWFASWDRIADRVARFDADVIALAEVTGDEQQSPDYWRTRFPEHSAVPLGEGMLVLVKGEARLIGTEDLSGRGESRRLGVSLPNARFDLLIADLHSHPHRPRQPPLQRVLELASKAGSHPTVIVGDFNTPPTSVWFRDWRTAGWHRAWEDAGSGYQSTWPLPFPILTLDHVWGNRQVRFHRCTAGWSSCSDHRPVLVEWSIRGDEPRMDN